MAIMQSPATITHQNASLELSFLFYSLMFTGPYPTAPLMRVC